MCIWILTVGIQFHFVFYVVSAELKNEKDESHMNKNTNESHTHKEVKINQEQEKFEMLKQDKNNSKKILQNFINLFDSNGTIKLEQNVEDFTTDNDFLFNDTEKIKKSTYLPFTTKLSFDILKLNKTNQDYINNTSFRRNENMTYELDLFLYNKSRSQLAIEPYNMIRKENRLDNVNIYKESKNNLSIKKYNDNKNSRNTSIITKENSVEFGSKEYFASKTHHDSIVREDSPKIERYKLGSIHFSNEMEIFDAKTTNNLKPYTTMLFDSDEGVTPNPVVFKQNKIPEDALETRLTRITDHFLTTTVIRRVTSKKTTEKPFRRELHQERVLMKMGPFTFFIYKLMEFLAAKRPSRLMKELTDQFLDVSLQLFQERPNLVEFGQPFRLGVIDFFTNIRTYRADTLQRMASIFHKALPKRWELFHVLVNVLYERIDQLYRQSEIHMLSNLLEDLKNYPNIEKNSTQFARSILVHSVVNPFTREGKTKRRSEMLARLNAYISFAFYEGRYLDLPGYDEAEKPPPKSGITPPVGSNDRGLDRFENTQQDLETSNESSIVEGFTTNMDMTENYDTLDNVTQIFENSFAQGFDTGSMTRANLGYGTRGVTTIKSTKMTKAAVRSGGKNINEQKGDAITDEEDILKTSLYRESGALEKSKYNDEDMLSSNLKYVSKHKLPKYSFMNKTEKSKDNRLKNVTQSSNNAKKKYMGNKNKFTQENRKDEGQADNVVFELIGKTSPNIPNTGKFSSGPSNIGTMRKKVLVTNIGRDKNIQHKEMSKQQNNANNEITESIFTPPLLTEKFKYETKSSNSKVMQSNSFSNKSSENILRHKIEIYNDASRLINRNTVSQDPSKTTESFLDLILKLDELVNSGERGVLDEILKTDDNVKDSTFQKIEAENEKFLQKEADVKVIRKPSKIRITKKESTQGNLKNKFKSQHSDYGRVYETAKSTKGHVEEILEKTAEIKNVVHEKIQEITKSAKKYVKHELKNALRTKGHEHNKYHNTKKSTMTKENDYINNTTKRHRLQHSFQKTIKSIRNGYTKHLLRENYNHNNINVLSKEEETAEHYTKKNSVFREKSDHKSKKTVEHSDHKSKKTVEHSDHKSKKTITEKSRNRKKKEFYLQTQIDYKDDQSGETTKSYTFVKLNVQAVTSQINRKPLTEYKNKKEYITKNTSGEFKEYQKRKKKYVKVQKEYASTVPISFKDDSKITSRHLTKAFTEDRVKLILLKDYKIANTSKSTGIKTTKYSTIKKSQNVSVKHRKPLKEIQKPLNSGVSYLTKRISILDTTSTESNSEKIFENHLKKAKKHRHNLKKDRSHKKSVQIKKDSQDNLDSSNNNVQRLKQVKVVNSIEDALANLKKAVSRYRPPERINKDFLRQEKEKNRRSKLKHSKKYRPLERIAGNVKVTKKKFKQIKLKTQQFRGSNGDEKSEDDAIISKDIDSYVVWNPKQSIERAVKQNSDDYYIVQGDRKRKVIFQDDENRYELKNYKEEQKVNNINVEPNSVDSRAKGNYSIMKKKQKKYDYLRARKRYTNNKTGTSSTRPHKKSNVNANEEKNESSEQTELLDKLIDGSSSAVSNNKGRSYEDDFDAPINEYTLKPVHNLNTKHVVITTTGIFDELRKLKNRLFHQNFRRDMNRKHKITLNELFLKKRSNVKKIIEESSYSDDEQDLKYKLQNALIQGRHKELNHNMRSQNTTESSKKTTNYEKFNEVSDSADEELVLKSNIYKGLGFNELN